MIRLILSAPFSFQKTMNKTITYPILVWTLCAAFTALTIQKTEGKVAFAASRDSDYAEAQQQDPLWCWAACIQLCLNRKDIYIKQPEIVARVKGYVKSETASNFEIAAFLNQWGIDKNGQPWIARCDYAQGAPNPAKLVAHVASGEPVIVSYQTGLMTAHVVVISQVHYKDTEWGPLIQGIVIFDPWSGQLHTVAGSAVATTTMGAWFVTVKKK